MGMGCMGALKVNLKQRAPPIATPARSREYRTQFAGEASKEQGRREECRRRTIAATATLQRSTVTASQRDHSSLLLSSTGGLHHRDEAPEACTTLQGGLWRTCYHLHKHTMLQVLIMRAETTMSPLLSSLQLPSWPLLSCLMNHPRPFPASPGEETHKVITILPAYPCPSRGNALARNCAQASKACSLDSSNICKD